jgi:hypothetical protein
MKLPTVQLSLFSRYFIRCRATLCETVTANGPLVQTAADIQEKRSMCGVILTGENRVVPR